MAAGCASQQEPVKKKKAAPEIFYSGGDGDSFETAIIINGVGKQSESVEAEYRYLAKLHGEKDKQWRVESQTITREEKSLYDVIEIALVPSGEKRFYYFDVTRLSVKPPPAE
jgi:hypothetical protein